MPKNHPYTGLLRTPPSMAWLIRERASLKGQIERLDSAHTVCVCSPHAADLA